jgi:hypothetical protein
LGAQPVAQEQRRGQHEPAGVAFVARGIDGKPARVALVGDLGFLRQQDDDFGGRDDVDSGQGGSAMPRSKAHAKLLGARTTGARNRIAADGWLRLGRRRWRVRRKLTQRSAMVER